MRIAAWRCFRVDDRPAQPPERRQTGPHVARCQAALAGPWPDRRPTVVSQERVLPVSSFALVAIGWCSATTCRSLSSRMWV